jgi:dihydrofolate reductase
MKKILIFVSSLDGKITKWGDPDIRKWSSKNDQDYFDSVWDSTRVILMGRKSYDSYPAIPSKKHIFIVLTREPEKFKDKEVPGQLEFTNADPISIVNRFANEGEELMLVLGGPHVATMFLNENLIDEIWLTIEPRIFGMGGSLVIDEKLDIRLKLLSCRQVNESGTLMTRYQVENPLPPKGGTFSF